MRPDDRLPTMIEITRACAEHFGLAVSQLRGDSMVGELVRARQVAMFLCRVDARRSFAEIGRYFNKSDHTSVMKADRRVMALREGRDERIEADLASIRRILEIAMGLVRKETWACPDCRALNEELLRLREEVQMLRQENAALRVRFGCD